MKEGIRRRALAEAGRDDMRLRLPPDVRTGERVIRLLIEDVTLRKDTQITAHVRFRGGTARTLTTPIPPRSWETWQADPLIVQEIDQLLDEHTDGEIAAILNERGRHAGSGATFHRKLVAGIRYRYQLADRLTRLRAQGLLTLQEMAALLAVHPGTVKGWHHHGLLRGIPFNDKGECLYEHPGDNPPCKRLGHKLCRRSLPPEHGESSAGGAV